MPAARVESVQVGRPRWHGTPGSTDPFDRPFATGFWKEPVTGPVAVRVTNLDGDGQADLVNHGGDGGGQFGVGAELRLGPGGESGEGGSQVVHRPHRETKKAGRGEPGR